MAVGQRVIETLAAWRDRLRDMWRRRRAARPETPTLQAQLRARFHRYLRMAGGFAVSVILLSVAALYVMAAAARPPLETAPEIAAPEGGSRGVAAAQYIFSLQTERDDVAADRLFAPAALKRREAIAFAAAEDAARAYVALTRVRRGARDPLLIAAREAAGGSGGAAAADALERLNAGATRNQIVIERAPAVFQALANEAAAAFAARAAFLDERINAGRAPARDDEAAFYGARGEALGWLLILRAAAADSESEDIRQAPEFARLLQILERAASRDPVLFIAGPRGGPAAPNHLAALGLDLAVAAQEARALAQP